MTKVCKKKNFQMLCFKRIQAVTAENSYLKTGLKETILKGILIKSIFGIWGYCASS